jgi:spermidine synthase
MKKFEECELIIDELGIYITPQDLVDIEFDYIRNLIAIDAKHDPVKRVFIDKIKEHKNSRILEIGFGLGITAQAAYSEDCVSYTIVESHPAVIPRLRSWSEDKCKVIPVYGRWQDRLDIIGSNTYDIVLYDSVDIPQEDKNFMRFIKQYLTPGGAIICRAWRNCINELTNDINVQKICFDEVETAYNTAYCMTLSN